MARTVLLLAGTSEAVELARRAEAVPGLHLIVSLAGRTRDPVRPPGEVRVGGFGGAAALARFIEAEDISAVVDATHPFAHRISANAAAACVEAGRPRLVLTRPPWTPGPGDRWQQVADAAAAAAALAPGARAFLTTGRTDIAAFATRTDVHYLVRLIDPPEKPLPLPDYELTIGRGPFTVAGERTLLASHDIEVVVTKNSGGGASRPKLDAAREAAIPVILIARPPPPEGETVTTVDAALAWLAGLS
jgi:precorrin-6A/cobalt-precorrin-6A reductase